MTLPEGEKTLSYVENVKENVGNIQTNALIFEDEEQKEYKIGLKDSGDGKHYFISVEQLESGSYVSLGEFQPDVSEFTGAYNVIYDDTIVTHYDSNSVTYFLGNEFMPSVNAYRVSNRLHDTYGYSDYKLISSFRFDNEKAQFYKVVTFVDYEDYEYAELLIGENGNLNEIIEYTEESGELYYEEKLSYVTDYSFLDAGLFLAEDKTMEFSVNSEDISKVTLDEKEYTATISHTKTGNIINLDANEEHIELKPSSSGVEVKGYKNEGTYAVNLLPFDYFKGLGWEEDRTYEAEGLKIKFYCTYDDETYDDVYEVYVNDVLTPIEYGVYNGQKVLVLTYNNEKIYVENYQDGISINAHYGEATKMLLNYQYFANEFVGTYKYFEFSTDGGLGNVVESLNINALDDIELNDEKIESQFIYDDVTKTATVDLTIGSQKGTLAFISTSPKTLILSIEGVEATKLFVSDDALNKYYGDFMDHNMDHLVFSEEGITYKGVKQYTQSTIIRMNTGYAIGFMFVGIFENRVSQKILIGGQNRNTLVYDFDEKGALVEYANFIPANYVLDMVQKFYNVESEYENDYFELTSDGKFYVPVASGSNITLEERPFYFQMAGDHNNSGMYPTINFLHEVEGQQYAVKVVKYDNFIRVAGQPAHYINEATKIVQGTFKYHDDNSSFLVNVDGINVEINGMQMSNVKYEVDENVVKIICNNFPDNYEISYAFNEDGVSFAELNYKKTTPPGQTPVEANVILTKSLVSKKDFLQTYNYEGKVYTLVKEFDELGNRYAYRLKDEEGNNFTTIGYMGIDKNGYEQIIAQTLGFGAQKYSLSIADGVGVMNLITE